jgi:hypothetical protein
MMILRELRAWSETLLPAAARKWLPMMAAAMPCQVPLMRSGHKIGDCERSAVGACDVCSRPVCLGHCRIDHNADAICHICVAEAMKVLPTWRREQSARQQQQQPPPQQKRGPSDEQIAAAYKTLGLKKVATWPEVKAATKRLMVKHHPDKVGTPREKAKAEAKFKEVQAAQELLKHRYPESA